MRSIRLTDRCRFSTRRFLPELVHGSDRVRVFLLCLEPGQGLPARADSEEMICYLIEGRAKVMLGEQVITVAAGDLAVAEAGEIRGIEAEERTVALWVHLSNRSSSAEEQP